MCHSNTNIQVIDYKLLPLQGTNISVVHLFHCILYPVCYLLKKGVIGNIVEGFPMPPQSCILRVIPTQPGIQFSTDWLRVPIPPKQPREPTQIYFFVHMQEPKKKKKHHMKGGLFFSRTCHAHFAIRGLKTLLFKSGKFKGLILMWNSMKSVFKL